MRIYHFQHDADGERRIFVTSPTHPEIELTPEASQRLWNHSSEFNWGYGGSGPAQTALAVMFDYFTAMPHSERAKRFPNCEDNTKALALMFYQSFKFKFIAGISQSKGGEITSEQIDAWLAAKQNPQPKSIEERAAEDGIPLQAPQASEPQQRAEEGAAPANPV